MTEEYVYWVDENDNVLGRVTRKEMRAKNLLHRSSDVLVFNSKGEILVHKRTMTKDLFPGYYSFLVGGSVQYGESYDECAAREVIEEIGAKNAKLAFLFKYKFKDIHNQVIVQLYRTTYDGQLTLQKEEIDSAEFMQLKKLIAFIKNNKFCTDDIEIFNKYMKEYHDQT